jgi:hypothetical protein
MYSFQFGKTGDQFSVLSLGPSMTSQNLGETACSVPTNPIKNQGTVSLEWCREFYTNKRDGHQSVSTRHLLQGHTENAEYHRALSREYAQKAEEIELFLNTRTN